MSGLSSLIQYRAVQNNREKQFAAYEKQPTVEKSISYFKEKIKTVDSVDALLKDHKLKTFVLQSFGLEELKNSNYMVKRILTDDLDSETAMANSMKDARFKTMASALRLDKGMGKLKDDTVIGALVERYKTQGFEAKIGDQSSAAREAMYFKRNIANATSIYQIMADPTLRKVATLGSNLPKQITSLDFDKQVSMFESKVDVSQLKDSKYVDRMISQFLIKSDLESVSTSSMTASLFSGSTGFSILV